MAADAYNTHPAHRREGRGGEDGKKAHSRIAKKTSLRREFRSFYAGK